MTEVANDNKRGVNEEIKRGFFDNRFFRTAIGVIFLIESALYIFIAQYGGKLYSKMVILYNWPKEEAAVTIIHIISYLFSALLLIGSIPLFQKTPYKKGSYFSQLTLIFGISIQFLTTIILAGSLYFSFKAADDLGQMFYSPTGF